MAYLDDVEKELRLLLKGTLGRIDKETDYQYTNELEVMTDNAVKLFREKLLESFKNGAQAARNQMHKRNQNKQKSKASK
ncbi:MAG: hypothetical protein GWO38_06300 [Phycisphaerae bacterium]|nr:hypothetical protein [Phycisphaerae bacterium]NIW48344.1 hypothetical protein [Gammaproteobacteria bacterium]NIW97694.1 hypothetical protein [Phycisphaerae bacterium]NIX27244.1 hypothetical protein [Phycisphaerae bacterium]